ncbi:restriction endonuclease subunit S [Deefgea piscis]|uniref:restriction endonuclease subunit S n=1 Tax=Deefgea piscis TaxID=2739061 RepID=UPI001C7E884B|nr:restriction endonuclease subunit S [Deefgea piscis]QZA82565.1 restriction endonuclease subunit S [Deefgea piscis]
MELKAGCKQTEIGVIPEDWEIACLSQLAELITSGSRGWAKYYSDSGALFVRSQNVRDGRLDFTDNQFVNPPKNSEGSRTQLKNLDLLITITGNSVGNVAIVEQELGEAYISQHVGLVRLSSPVLGKFICYFLSPNSSGNLQILASQSGQSKPGLTLKNIHDFWIALPPIHEQNAIVAALSDVDTLLAKLDALIAKKRDLKQAAMQQLLTAQTRLPGFVGEWVNVALGDIADSNQKWSFTGGPFGSNLKSSDYIDDGVRIIQLQNIGDGEFHNDSKVFTTSKKADELLSCNIYPGEIILSKMGDPVARACIIPPHHERYLMCSDGIRLVVNPKKFNTYFIFLAINYPDFRSRAENAGTGSTRKRIGLTELRNLEIFCPPLPEQIAIVTILSDMDAEITALEARRDKTRTLKQGMMQELLTGKTRLI